MSGLPAPNESASEPPPFPGDGLPRVTIRGDGVAAACCRHLLSQRGYRIDVEHVSRPRLPALLLNESAVSLMCDVFGAPDLFRNAHRIRRRIVAWGPHAQPRALDHFAVVISEQALLDGLQPSQEPASQKSPADTGWAIFASRPLPRATEQAFGARLAFAAPVRLKKTSDREACWIESTENGWRFLIAGPDGSGSLLCVGSAPEEFPAREGLVAGEVEELSGPWRQFPAYPRISSPLCAPQWLACGSAAMAFDPICGDGTGHAIREAILAAAVIRAVTANMNAESLLLHYEARMTAGFRRHLLLCREFYRSGACGPWWHSELESLERGIAWCDDKLRSAGEFHYRLVGFDLQES